MKVIDENNYILESPDLEKGFLEPDRLFIAHHEAVPAIKEKWHYETVAEYFNGGKDVVKVIDVMAQEGKAAWDEYEDVQRYIKYSPERLEEMNSPSEIDELESKVFYIAMRTGNAEVFNNV